MQTRSWVLLLVAAASCGRCGGAGSSGSAASAEELLPAQAAGALLFAPLGIVAQHTAALVERAGALPGGEPLGETRRSTAAQLGFDPLTREGLVSAGLDPDRGAAVAVLQGSPAARPSFVAALPLVKPDAFTQTLDRLLRERAGFANRSDVPAGGARAAVYDRGSGDRIAIAVVRGYGLVARSEDPARLIADAAAQTAGTSLQGSAPLKAARDRLGAQDVLAFAPRGSELPHRFTARALPGDVGVALSPSAQGLALRLFAQVPPERMPALTQALPGGGGSLVELLPGDAPLKLRLGIAPSRVLAFLEGWPRVGEALSRLRAAAHTAPGADVEQDVLGALAPGAAISVALLPSANLGEIIDYGLDPRRRSPFSAVQLVALAGVSDRARLLRGFEGLARALPQLGAQAARTGTEWQITYPGGNGGRFGLRELDGSPVAWFAGGLAPEQLKRTPKVAALDAAALYQDAGAAGILELVRLSDAVRALPESAYGNGPQAYVARSLASQIVEPLRPLRVTGSASAAPDGLLANLAVEISPP